MSGQLINLDAEQAVLGALLADNSLIERIPDLIGADFYDPMHGRIFEWARASIKRGRVADPVSLYNAVKAEPAFEEIGGNAYLALLVENAGLTSTAVQYARIVCDLSLLRQLHFQMQQFCHGILGDPTLSPVDAVGRAEVILRGLPLSGQAQLLSLWDAAVGSAESLGANEARGLRLGISALDKRLGGFFPGELIVLGGRPGFGKSAMANTLMRNMGFAGARLHVAQQEMSDRQLGDRTLGAIGNVEYSLIRRDPDKLDKEMLMEAAQRAPRNVLIDFQPAQTLAQLESRARETRRRLGGLDAIIVDYLQLMRPVGRHTNRDGEIRELSQGLKIIAKSLLVPVLALAQLSRDSEKDERRPRMSDLRDGGSIEQDADVIMMLFREAYFLERKKPSDPASIEFLDWQRKYNEKKFLIEVHTVKQRQGPVGFDELRADLSRDMIMDKDAAPMRSGPRYSGLERD